VEKAGPDLDHANFATRSSSTNAVDDHHNGFEAG
jgi:hypothetical protein